MSARGLGRLDHDHVPVDLAVVAVGGLVVTAAGGEVDAAADLFVEEDVLHRFGDERVDADREFADVAGALVGVEHTLEAEDAWVDHVNDAGAKILRTQANSWFVGANIPGKARVLLTSPDSAPVTRAKRAEVAAKGYEGFLLQ